MRIASLTRRATIAAVAVAVPALFAAPASAGDYVLAQCDSANRGYDEARFDRTTGAYYEMERGCSSAAQQNALRIDNLAAAPVAAEGRIRFSAPEGTGVTGVSVAASLRSDAGHASRLSFLDAAGNQNGRIATGPDEPGGFQNYSQKLDGVGRAGFAALLVCAEQRPCPESEQARTAIRDVRITLRDRVAPTLTPSGSLLAGGWVRGSRTLSVSAADVGAGVRTIDVRAGSGSAPLAPSRTLPCATIGSTGMVSRAVPCPRSTSAQATVDTARGPFVNGANPVTICATDYGSSPNRICATRTVNVDNAAPSGAFRPISEEDPELIAADLSDSHSGVGVARIAYRSLSGGDWVELSTAPTAGGYAARVDSDSVPPGRYEFRLIAADRAGNATTITRTRDGRPMVLDFPLLEETRVRARIATLGHRTRYGSRPRVKGAVETISGRGLEGLPLVVTERFEPGSRPKVRTRTVTSGAAGRFAARLSAGPSRKVTVSFAGNPRLSASVSRARKLAVAGKVSLRLSRRSVKAGERVRFRGRIGTMGAKVPAPGKVVELQVRERGQRRFRTVDDAIHSGRRGTVRASYRFGRFYTAPTRFQFRLKVTRQAGWPYRAPTHSRPRTLTVKPRG